MPSYKTKQRELILDCLKEHSDIHITAEEITQQLKMQGDPVGRSTVYRYLERLIEDGVVHKYQNPGESSCYQLALPDGRCHQHFHLKCVSCGQLLHMECDYMTGLCEHIRKEHGFEIDVFKTVLYGTCGKCRISTEKDGKKNI